jgi:dTDP-4-dehydrorhamnose 3,5-epimerase
MPFTFKTTQINGLTIIQPRVYGDKRGFFMETYKKDEFMVNGIEYDFVQDNHSYSGKHILRGLHFQKEPFAQGKLVQVITGSVWDVAVDLRKDSPTFMQWYGIELNDRNNTMFFIPPGFAHGFVTLSDNVHFTYKCTNYYSPEHDAGIIWNDPDLGIEWPVKDVQVSEKDAKLPFLKDIEL